MKTLAYLVYGNKREYRLELAYSLASIVPFEAQGARGIRRLLVTDQPDLAQGLPVDVLLIDKARLAEWTQDGQYSHAAKIHALAAVLEHSDGPVALIDTDTYFLRSPGELFARIGSGRSVMQAADAPIGQLHFWRRLLANAPATVAGYAISAASPMNNSGVIGMDPTDRGIVPEMIALMGELHSIDPVFNIEQFAVTCVLDRHTELSVAPDIVHHYWPLHERWFIHAAVENAAGGTDPIAIDRLSTPFIRFGYPPKRVIDQVAARVRGTIGGWDHVYRYAYLAYLSALSSRSVREANVWAAIAADALRDTQSPTASIRSDFRKLAIARPAWLDNRAASAWQQLSPGDPLRRT